MASPLRFMKAVDNTRPYKSHRYDVFGPKIQRMLTLFGRNALDAWTMLESDPDIQAYCERPIVVEGAKPRRVVDFWVRRRQGEELWLLLRPTETEALVAQGGPTPAFSTWAASQGMKVILIDPAQWIERQFFLENWGEILRYVAANRRLLGPTLTQRVYGFLQAEQSIGAIEESLPEEDPILVRTTVFSMLHGGKLQCPNISLERISRTTCVGRV